MKIINVDVNDEIIMKSILDADTGVLTGISSVLNLPTGNLNNIILNFTFANDCLCDKFNLACSFNINGKKTIDMKIDKIKVNEVEYKTACHIPAEVFEDPCWFEIGIYGIAVDDANNVHQRISLFPLRSFVYKGSYDPNSSEASVPTPSLFEQYFDEVAETNKEMQENLEEVEEILNQKVMLYRKYETSYVASVGETEIPIGVANFSDTFNLIADKNGLVLMKDTEYTINYDTNTITLATEITQDNTVIHFVAFASVIGNQQDMTNVSSGGGEGGTNNYPDLVNKPKINGFELVGDKSSDKLGLAPLLHAHNLNDIADIDELEIPVATADKVGGVKVGSGLEITEDGTLNATGGGGSGGTTDYTDLSNKPKINGVELSGNKTTTDLGIADATHTHKKADIDDLTVPTKVSELENDTGFITTAPTKTSELTNDSSFATESFVTNAIANAQIGGGGGDIDLSGYATKDDLTTKVDKVTGKSLIADTEIERLKTVENYDDTAIKESINAKANATHTHNKADITDLKEFSNKYPDLDDKPSINGVELVGNKGVLELGLAQQMHTHFANEITDLEVPTKTSQLTNDSGFVTSVPTKTSELTNDSGFITKAPTKTSELTNDSNYVSSTDITSIKLVTEYPTTEETGVLYIRVSAS